MDNYEYLITIEKKIFDIYNDLLKNEFENNKNDIIAHELWLSLERYVEKENDIINSIINIDGYDDDEDEDSNVIGYYIQAREQALVEKTGDIDDISFSILNDYEQKEEYLIQSRLIKKLDNKYINKIIHLTNDLSIEEYMSVISSVINNELATTKVKNFDLIIKNIEDPILRYEMLANKYSVMYCNDISKFNYNNMCDRSYLNMYNYNTKLIDAQCNQESKEKLSDMFSIIYGQLTDDELTYNLESQIDSYTFVCELQTIVQTCDRNTFEEIYYEIYKKVLNRRSANNTIITNEIKRVLNKRMAQYYGVNYEKRKK